MQSKVVQQGCTSQALCHCLGDLRMQVCGERVERLQRHCTCWMTRLTVPCGSPTGSPSEMTMHCSTGGAVDQATRVEGAAWPAADDGRVTVEDALLLPTNVAQLTRMGFCRSRFWRPDTRKGRMTLLSSAVPRGL